MWTRRRRGHIDQSAGLDKNIPLPYNHYRKIAMDIMDTIDEITCEYYSRWTGVKISPQKSGLFLKYNPERDAAPKGYSRSMDVYVFWRPPDKSGDRLVVISYGNRAKEKIEAIAGKGKIEECGNIDSLRLLLKETFLTDVGKNIKYVYKNRVENPLPALVLNAAHYDLFLEFFRANNPDNGDCSWVKDYFLEIASKNYCHGIIVDNKLVSVTDAPDMPYMPDLVQEIGINTLKEYRGRGYARAACVSLTKELLSRNICPVWSTGEKNTASDRLARSVGFEKFADVLTVNIPK
jgi:RimJ/RimL family protein N-acetyltransferase